MPFVAYPRCFFQRVECRYSAEDTGSRPRIGERAMWTARDTLMLPALPHKHGGRSPRRLHRLPLTSHFSFHPGLHLPSPPVLFPCVLKAGLPRVRMPTDHPHDLRSFFFSLSCPCPPARFRCLTITTSPRVHQVGCNAVDAAAPSPSPHGHAYGLPP